MSTNKPTCGPLYLEGVREFCGGDVALQKAFAAGFVSGQAEKVYLGACKAAMFRPSAETRGWLVPIIDSVCDRYDLRKTFIAREIWITRPVNCDLVIAMIALEPNSMAWHHMRGELCGIPEEERDLRFHERTGYAEKCDGSEASK